tara:strand:+ start:506 stop:934 length:429 start_codon:yes stop_codon:yes gene_type:complete
MKKTTTHKVEAIQSIAKVNDDKRLVSGWFSIISKGSEPVIDRQGDYISEDTLVEAAHEYMRNCRVGKEMHDGEQIAEVVEMTVFTKDMQDGLGIDLGFVGGWLVMKVHDDKVWAKVKSGELPSFSIGGTCTTEIVDRDEINV